MIAGGLFRDASAAKAYGLASREFEFNESGGVLS